MKILPTVFDPDRYDGRMPYRRCGESGLLLPTLSLGLWHNFGSGDDPEEAARMMRCAFDQGVTHFDLANNYGPPPGSAEENFGHILSRNFVCHRDELVISTKAGHDMWQGPYGSRGSRKHLLASLDQSLKRMRLDYVDIFYSHCPDPDTPIEETMSALATAVQSGKALYVGLSKYPPKPLKKAVRILRELGTPCLVHQIPYSMLRRSFEKSESMAWCEQRGIGNVVFSPLAQGMLTGKYLSGMMPPTSRAAQADGFLRQEQVKEQEEKVQALAGLARSHGIPLHHLALAWALRHSSVTSAIVGARTSAQLVESLKCLSIGELSQDLIGAIDAIVPL